MMMLDSDAAGPYARCRLRPYAQFLKRRFVAYAYYVLPVRDFPILPQS